MSLELLREETTSLFINVMTNAYPAASLTFDNIRYENPRTGEWVHFAIMPDNRIRADLGPSPTYRSVGNIFMRVMGKEESGTATLYGIIDTLLLGMSDLNLSIANGSCHTYSAMLNNRGIIEGWQTFEIQIEYKYDAQT